MSWSHFMTSSYKASSNKSVNWNKANRGIKWVSRFFLVKKSKISIINKTEPNWWFLQHLFRVSSQSRYKIRGLFFSFQGTRGRLIFGLILIWGSKNSNNDISADIHTFSCNYPVNLLFKQTGGTFNSNNKLCCMKWHSCREIINILWIEQLFQVSLSALKIFKRNSFLILPHFGQHICW